MMMAGAALALAVTASRWSLHAGVGLATATPEWRAEARFTEFAEPGIVATRYVPHSAPGFEAGVWHGMTPHLGIALTVTRFDRDTAGDFVALLPHPLYLARPRSVGGALEVGSQRETAVHFGLAFSATRGGIVARLSGGPSYFLVGADVVDRVSYEHEYPYDAVRVTGLRRSAVRGDALGGHAALTLERRIAGRVAVGAGARWSRATIPLIRAARPDEDARERSARVPAGGVNASAVIRLYF